jgi:hypothetical protein
MTMPANCGNMWRKQQRTRLGGCRGTAKESRHEATPGPAREKFPLLEAKTRTLIAPHLTTFFEQRLPIERHVSENTRDSYAYAFQLLLTFASKRLDVLPSQLALEQIDEPLVLDFLNDLETTRGNGPSSRNIRLAAIKSFMHFLDSFSSNIGSTDVRESRAWFAGLQSSGWCSQAAAAITAQSVRNSMVVRYIMASRTRPGKEFTMPYSPVLPVSEDNKGSN